VEDSGERGTERKRKEEEGSGRKRDEEIQREHKIQER
jgi:hypothetical protein